MKSPIYLLPHDFSPVADSALHMALQLADHNDGTVLMLHFVDKRQNLREAREKFAQIVATLSPQEQERVSCRAVHGSVFDHIGIASEIVGASMIVMGTHGAKGLQKLFGSHALRLVSSTHVPFLITQGNGSLNGQLRNIVMPYYFQKESMQIANFAGFLAKQFNATIHLVGSHQKDEWMESNTQANQVVLRKFFAEHDVHCELVNLPQEASYQKELMSYAESVNADLIAVSYHNDSLLPTMHTFVQVLIENDKQIPVLTVNTEDLTVSSGALFHYMSS